MTNELVVIIVFKVPKIKKISLHEMKFFTKLQLPPEPLTRGLPPPYPRFLCPQLNLLNPPPLRTKYLRTPLLTAETGSFH